MKIINWIVDWFCNDLPKDVKEVKDESQITEKGVNNNE